MRVPYWSTESLIFYLLLAIFGLWCASMIKRQSKPLIGKKFYINFYVLLWASVWTFFAVFRVVKDNVGGADALAYINFFNGCNGYYENDLIMVHSASDPLFLWINKIVRYLTSDYHWYFVAIYGFLSVTYIRFVSKYSSKKTSIIPFVLVFYLYLRGFSSIRSNLAIGFILMSIMMLAEEKIRKAYILALLAIFIHKGAILYTLAIPFCHYFKRRNLGRIQFLLFLIVISFIALSIRETLISIFGSLDIQGAYASYIERAMESETFYWVDMIGQMLLGVVLFVFMDKIKKDLAVIDYYQSNNSFHILWLVCLYDVMLVPVAILLGIWRSYEFFFIVRLSMWGTLLYIITRKSSPTTKYIINSMVLVGLLFWMTYRISRTYESTCLMPYWFSPISI